MGDKFYATTQYNDLKGTAAFDGHEGPPVFELAKRSNMPAKTYWPVGFELFRLDPDEEVKVPFTLLAIKCEEAGNKIDDILEYVKTTEKINVYRFEGKIKPEEFALFFKRVDIKAIAYKLPREKIDLCYPPEE